MSSPSGAEHSHPVSHLVTSLAALIGRPGDFAAQSGCRCSLVTITCLSSSLYSCHNSNHATLLVTLSSSR
ncbi:hypothetical protein ACQRIT_000691 [Beauveria bassiana]